MLQKKEVAYIHVYLICVQNIHFNDKNSTHSWKKFIKAHFLDGHG